MYKEYSLSLISLLKGVVYAHQPEIWENLVTYEHDIKKYVAAMGLELWLDKSEGYAYVRQIESVDNLSMPKIADKRQLNFHVSLLCLILRRHLLETDAQGGSGKTTISHQDIINRMQSFLPYVADEAKQQDKLSASVNKVIDMGFLRKMEDSGNDYEIHRIIKGYVNADVVENSLTKLRAYAEEKNIND
jgi:Domain of unknown function (DUF4194)